MQNPPPQEAAFFEALDAETPIEIHVRTAAMSVSNLRREVLRHCSGELFADTSETSVARYFKRGCSRFKSLHEAARSAPTAKGVGRSHFAQIGQEYKGVKVSDATHLVLYGRRLEITAQSNWNFIDRALKAHFADEPFTVTRANVLNLSTPDEKFLLSAIHRETVEEAGQKRRGNKRYTGRAWFAEPR